MKPNQLLSQILKQLVLAVVDPPAIPALVAKDLQSPPVRPFLSKYIHQFAESPHQILTVKYLPPEYLDSVFERT
jgi:hypothetical protein